jgi:hypothetical protein
MMSVFKIFKNSSFVENLWHNLLLVTIVLFVMLIVMLLSRPLY